MTTLAVTFYDVVVWLHISAVVVGFGGTFAYGVIIATAAKADPRSLPGVLAGISANSRSLVTIGSIVVLLTGIYLAADAWDFGYFFIAWGVVAILILLGLIHGYFLPNEKRAAEAAARDVERAGPTGEVEFGPEFERANAGLAKVGSLAGILIVLTVYVMTAKPFL